MNAAPRLTGGCKLTADTWSKTQAAKVVKGTMTCTVTDISTAAMPNTYQAVFTLTYNYLNHYTGGAFPPYSVSMTIVRTSDT